MPTKAGRRPRFNVDPRLRLVAPVLASAVGAAACGGHSQAEPQPSRSPQAVSSSSQHKQKVVHAALGRDVSWPQCGEALPPRGAFNIVGINGDLANELNPCFAQELRWAGAKTAGSPGKTTSFYANVADTGSRVDGKKVTDWPSHGRTPYGVCAGKDTKACSYEQGVQFAKADAASLPKGLLHPLIWLDIEPEHSWLRQTANNRATVEAMTKVFRKEGDRVGIYSSPSAYAEIMGQAPEGSNLAGLPDWILGATTEGTAEANCDQTGFTGKIVLAQIAGSNFDRDLVC